MHDVRVLHTRADQEGHGKFICRLDDIDDNVKFQHNLELLLLHNPLRDRPPENLLPLPVPALLLVLHDLFRV